MASGSVREACQCAACRQWATLKPSTTTRNAAIATTPTILVAQESAVALCACRETLTPTWGDDESR